METYSKEIQSAVDFQGVDAYISPSWYPTKHEHGKVVPTWNYVVVHAWGTPRIIEDPEWLLDHVEEITATHEKDQQLPWKVSDTPTGTAAGFSGFAHFRLVCIAPGMHNDHGDSLRQLKDRLPSGLLVISESRKDIVFN